MRRTPFVAALVIVSFLTIGGSSVFGVPDAPAAVLNKVLKDQGAKVAGPVDVKSAIANTVGHEKNTDSAVTTALDLVTASGAFVVLVALVMTVVGAIQTFNASDGGVTRISNGLVGLIVLAALVTFIS